MSAPEPDALADEIRVSSAASEGRTLFEDAYSAQLDYLNLLRAINARFLAIGGGLASLEARVSDLDRAHSERLMAVEERGIAAQPIAPMTATELQARRPSLPQKTIDTLTGSLSESALAKISRGIDRDIARGLGEQAVHFEAIAWHLAALRKIGGES